MESCTSGVSCTSWSLIQRATNSCICTDMMLWFASWGIRSGYHFVGTGKPSCSFGVLGRKGGALGILELHPLDNYGARNVPLLPFPIVIVVEALKRNRSRSLHDSSIPAQGFESSTHSCHNHRMRGSFKSFHILLRLCVRFLLLRVACYYYLRL